MINIWVTCAIRPVHDKNSGVVISAEATAMVCASTILDYVLMRFAETATTRL